MSCKIITSKSFLRAVKHLSKRYKSIKKDLIQLQESLQNDPLLGADLGMNLRKVRMAITAKGKGKSGGVRVITYTLLVADVNSELMLLTIYDKSEKENISEHELLEILKENGLV